MNAKEKAHLAQLKTTIDQDNKKDNNLEALHRLAAFLDLPPRGGCGQAALEIIQHPNASPKVRALALNYYTRHAVIGARWTLIREVLGE